MYHFRTCSCVRLDLSGLYLRKNVKCLHNCVISDYLWPEIVHFCPSSARCQNYSISQTCQTCCYLKIVDTIPTFKTWTTGKHFSKMLTDTRVVVSRTQDVGSWTSGDACHSWMMCTREVVALFALPLRMCENCIIKA